VKVAEIKEEVTRANSLMDEIAVDELEEKTYDLITDLIGV